MKTQKTTLWWLWFVVPIAALTTWKIFRNTANAANRTTEDLDSSTAQAVKFFEYFGVVVTNLMVTATPVLLTSTKNLIGWLAMNIDDWQKVQRAFTQLCGGNYTIFQAASTALNSTDYSGFTNLIEKAQTQKRIFCTEDSFSMRNVNQYGGVLAVNYNKGDFVGRCQREDDTYYYYTYYATGETLAVEKNKFKLV